MRRAPASSVRRRTARALRLAPAAAACAMLGACTAAPPGEWASVQEVTPAFLRGVPARAPALAAGPGGRVAIAYVARGARAPGVWVALSSDSGASFAPPVRVDDAHAGAPAPGAVAVAIVPGGGVVVAWTAARDSAPGDDVLACTDAGGEGFGPPRAIDADPGEPAVGDAAGLALDATEGRTVAAWLAGAVPASAPGEPAPAGMQVRAAVSEDGGHSWRPDVRVADGAAPGAVPALRASPSGRVAIAYRGGAGGGNDARLALSFDGGTTFAWDTVLAADTSRPARPGDSGPALTLTAEGGLCAWPAGAGRDGPGVYVVPWRDHLGATATPRAFVDSVRDATRPLLVRLGSAALAGVLARPGPRAPHATLAVRRLAADGSASPWIFLGAQAGDPALAAADARHAFAAWVEQGEDGPRVRLARLTRH